MSETNETIAIADPAETHKPFALRLPPATANPETPSDSDGRVRPLGEQLVRAGLVTPNELESALQRQSTHKSRLGEVLLELGFVEEETLLPFLERQAGVPAVRLREGLVDPVAVRLLPRRKAEQLKVLSLFKVRNELLVAMADPFDLPTLDEIERVTGLRPRPVIALQSTIDRLRPRCYEEDFVVDAVTAHLDDDAVELTIDSLPVDLQDMESMADGSPIVNLVNYLIVQAVRQGASDIHIEPGAKHSVVRFRVDGQLREVLRPRKDFHPAIVSRIKVMSRMDIAERRVPQDGRMHVLVEKREIDLRTSTLPTVLGEKVVLRVLDRANVTFNLDQLGVPRHQLAGIKDILRKPYGLVLVTGPTGSGKTTTLYSAIELIKSVHSNIVTVEDPVEYQLSLINQVHANGAGSLSFASALRSILRQDPDVIMVGEIRDGETADMAIQAALTGHLVLSTLHTNDCAGAITRLLDMGVASYKIASSVAGVIAQRLVRTICPKCRAQHYPSADVLDLMHYEGDRNRQFARGEGCVECYDTGYIGRTGIYEVMQSTRDLRDLIIADPRTDKIRDWHRTSGGTTLLDEGIRIAEAGMTSLEEVARVALFE